MSAVKFINSNYLKGPKGDKGDKGDSGTGVLGTSGRITYNPKTKIVGFNATGLATESYVNSSISALINGAPTLLDTLKELADAIDNNPDFISEISTEIDLKLAIAGGTMTGPLILNADPATALGAATKQYVDAAISAIPMNTDEVVEGTTNLYYTAARARAAISVTGAGSYDSTTGVITVTGGVTSVNTQTGDVVLSTSEIIEGSNLYYTTARANTDFDNRLTTKTTTDLAEGTNLYFTNTRARSAISVSGDLNYDSATGVISFSATAGFSGNYNDLTNKPDIPNSILDLGISDGTVGQFLQTDGSGNFTFVSSEWDGATLDGGAFDSTEILPGEIAIDGGFLESFYNPTTASDWSGTAPVTVSEALDRLAAVVKALNGGVGA